MFWQTQSQFYKGELHVQRLKIKGQYSSSPPILHGDGARGNKHKLAHDKILTGLRKKPCITDKLSGEAVESLPLGTFKTQPDAALINLV